MFTHLKPYAEYKDSGLPWLGKVPAHWDVLPLGRLLAERKEMNEPIKTNNILSLSLHDGVIPYADKRPGGNKAKDDLTAYKLAYPGDIVLNSMNVVVGSVGLSKYFGAVSPVYYMLYPRHAGDLVRFFNAIFQHSIFQRSLFGLGNGILVIQSRSSGKLNTIRMRIPMTKLKLVHLPYPAADEQAAIVRFLDNANGRIERAIRAKKKLIALLNEQKQVIIHRAVTRGLDANVPIKPSGIPWLGEIPEHWEVRRLRHLILGRLTYGANEAAEHDNKDWPRYLRITDFRSDGSLRPDTFRSLPPDVAEDYLVQPGDILLARSGATVGKAFIVKADAEKACHAGYLIRARPNAKFVIPEFLFAFTQSAGFREWKDCTFNTATIQNIGADKYVNLTVPLPPTSEQLEILGFIETKTDPINVAILRAEREITLLHEYRTRLVADVVTGKLDVREAAKNLPAEAEEAPLELKTEEPIEEETTDEKL